MEKRRYAGLARLFLLAVVYLSSVQICGAQTDVKPHDIQAARERMEKRVTDKERKAVAVRQAQVHPALAAKIAETRAALTSARDARIKEIQGGANE